jgi:hypothetical protein
MCPTRFLILSVLILSGFSLFAETTHQGVVGGPFHGYAQDDTGQVQVQIGPIADFAVPPASLPAPCKTVSRPEIPPPSKPPLFWMMAPTPCSTPLWWSGPSASRA